MISAKRLTKFYDNKNQALQGLDLEIGDGEFVAIIGRSGAGKTTFLRQINGMIAPSSGELHVLGFDLRKMESSKLRILRRDIGFIFQQFNLVKSLNALENVLLGRLGHYSSFKGAVGLFSKTDRIRAAQLLELVGLEGREEARADQLSGGQQQRVAVARVLMQDPKIILADEPTASLDPRSSEIVLELLKKINREKKRTIVLNVHLVEYAVKYADRIVGLKWGRVAYDGKPEGLTPEVLKSIYD